MREEKTLEFKMSGLLEAVDHAFKVMKSPKTHFFRTWTETANGKLLAKNNLKKCSQATALIRKVSCFPSEIVKSFMYFKQYFYAI